jgi:hypothetical protein
MPVVTHGRVASLRKIAGWLHSARILVQDEHVRPFPEIAMTDRLDTLLTALQAAPADRDLSRIEPGVWHRIEQAQLPPLLAGWRVPAISAVMALMVGFASTATAAPPAEASAFSSTIDLAPSTLLERHR